MVRPVPRNKLRSEHRHGDPVGRYTDDRPQLLRLTCHGDPERCFYYKGRPMALCARCLGFYIGSLVGSPWGIAMAYLGMSSIMVVIIFVLLSAPLAVDGMTQYLGWRESNNRLRLMTGLLSGFGSGMGASYLIYMLATL